jgi:hypothetical protein
MGNTSLPVKRKFPVVRNRKFLLDNRRLRMKKRKILLVAEDFYQEAQNFHWKPGIS